MCHRFHGHAITAARARPGRPVTLSWTNPTGQRFELQVAVDDGYLFTVTQRVDGTVERFETDDRLRPRQP